MTAPPPELEPGREESCKFRNEGELQSRQISPRHNCMHDHITSPVRSRHSHPSCSKYQRVAREVRRTEREEEDSGFDKRTAKTTNPKLGENRRRSPLLEITYRKRHRNLGSPASHTAPFRDIFRAHISGRAAARPQYVCPFELFCRLIL